MGGIHALIGIGEGLITLGAVAHRGDAADLVDKARRNEPGAGWCGSADC